MGTCQIRSLVQPLVMEVNIRGIHDCIIPNFLKKGIMFTAYSAQAMPKMGQAALRQWGGR